MSKGYFAEELLTWKRGTLMKLELISSRFIQSLVMMLAFRISPHKRGYIKYHFWIFGVHRSRSEKVSTKPRFWQMITVDKAVTVDATAALQKLKQKERVCYQQLGTVILETLMNK